MFRLAKGFMKASPRMRRAAFVSGTAAVGIAATTSIVAFAAPPHRVTESEVSTAVPALTPRELSEKSSYDQVKAESEAAEQKQAEGAGENRQAYNPETGEIDWDCPCLGGMAHGPCGEEFKEAFSCFVYSKEEIRGSECIPKFSAMQDCFRKYPEVYSEFNDDTETVAESDKALKEQQIKEEAQEVKETVTDGVQKAKESAEESLQAAKENVSENLGPHPVETIEKGIESSAEGAHAALSDAISSASEVASDLTAKYKTTLGDASTEASQALSEYASKAQEAAKEVAQEAKSRAQSLDRNETTKLIEEKLHAAHELAANGFDNMEKNQSPFRQTQKFATGAVAGIAAEAKEAVHYVSDQISKK